MTCEICLDLDSRMKATESDEEWNTLYERLEQHKLDAHMLSENDALEEESNGEAV